MLGLAHSGSLANQAHLHYRKKGPRAHISIKRFSSLRLGCLWIAWCLGLLSWALTQLECQGKIFPLVGDDGLSELPEARFDLGTRSWCCRGIKYDKEAAMRVTRPLEWMCMYFGHCDVKVGVLWVATVCMFDVDDRDGECYVPGSIRWGWTGDYEVTGGNTIGGSTQNRDPNQLCVHKSCRKLCEMSSGPVWRAPGTLALRQL